MSLRKMLLIALAAMFVLSATALFAAPPRFILSGTTFVLRQTGQTEVVGDLILTSTVTGTIPGPASMLVVYGAQITNATAGAPTGTFTFSNGTATRAANVEYTGATAGLLVSATLSAGNTITVNFGGTGVVTAGDIIRVMGIRVNIGDPGIALGTSINGTMLAVPPNAFQIDNVNTFPVGFVAKDITAKFTGSASMLTCTDVPQAVKVTVTEQNPQVFTTLTDETDINHQPLAPSKAATVGTKVLVTFSNVLPGIKITAPGAQDVTSTATVAALLDASTPSPVTNTGAAPITVTFLYNITADSQIGPNESLVFVFTFDAVGPFGTPPVLGSITGTVTLAPNGTPVVASATTTKLISFAVNQLPSPAAAVGTLNLCVTNLLCKFLTTATGAVPGGGYDTGLAIANTSKDIFGALGAVPQQGVCRVNLFGTGGTIPATPFTTPVVTPGQIAVFDLKFNAGVGAGFQGYAIVQCDFQFAHAEAIIADQQFSTFSHGYDCLVIPDPNFLGFPRVAGAGESLDQKRADR